MNKKIAFLTAIIPLLLGAAFAYGTASDQESTTASVGVNEFIDFTITVNGTIGFGDLDPGMSNSSASGQPAVTLTVEMTTNADVEIRLKGDDFNTTIGDYTIAATVVKYDDDATLSEGMETGLAEGALATSYGTAWTTITAPCGGSAVSTSVYHWISIPSGQHAGDYASTFYYQAD